MTYLKLHVLTGGCILASLCSPASAASLTSGQVYSGTIAAAAQTNSYTFSTNAGAVVNFTMSTTTGSLIPKIELYGPTGALIGSNYSGSPGGCYGSTVEMSTVMLSTTGVYTVVVRDCSAARTGTYNLYAQRTNGPFGALNLTFGHAQAGTIASAAESDTYTFTANANADVVFTMTATSGNLVPLIRLYNTAGKLMNSNYSGSPGGCYGSTVEMNTVTIPVTGTYTVLLGDCSHRNTGNYEIYAQITDIPAGAVSLLFGNAQAGSIGSAAQSNTYTFSGNAGDVLDFTLAATSGSLIPKIRLFDPAGKLISSNYSGSPGGCYGSTVEMNTVTLASAGTHTVLVGDCKDTNTGGYAIYSQRTKNPAGAVNLPFGGLPQSGLIGSAAESDTYTLSANANDVVSFTLVTTTGGLIPKIRLYDPAGKLVSSNYSGSPGGCYGSVVEMNTVKLASAGTYTVLVGDCRDTNTGNYALYSQRTNNPGSPVHVIWGGQPQPGSIAKPAQSNTYIFNATANAVVSFTMTTTSGVLIPKIRLYNPAGQLVKSNYSGSPGGCYGTSVQLNTVTLALTGTYTALVGDCKDTSTGAYNLSSLCIGTCQSSAATPVFTPGAGTYTSAQAVKITDTTAGAVIYYTTNGSTPTTSSTKYVGPITVSSTMVIKAIAVAAGYAQSAVASAAYTIVGPPVGTPVFAPAPGTYTSVQYVRITDATSGSAIYYTTNGTTPTTNSIPYTGPIRVAVTQTIKAIAVRTGYTNSSVATAVYTVSGSPSALAAPAAAIGTSTATLNAVVNTNGLVGSYVFQYGTSATVFNISTGKSALAASTAPVAVSAPLTGLATKTRYYYRVVVTTAGGTGIGAVLSFVTN